MPKLSEAEIEAALPGLLGWSRNGDEVCKEYKFSDFGGAMSFVNRVAALAEANDHHPDMDIRYNRVTLALSTHSEGGITQKDVDLAQQIEAVDGASAS